jgi:tetratricopeptide (TPR) repeat protein
VLDQALARSDVLLAIIGPDWLAADSEGKRRLDDPNDWVRREIVTALGLGRVQVIPVLVGDADLPTASELPKPLQVLPGRQAITVRPDRFDDDVDNLIDAIGGWRRRWHGFPLWAWIGAGALLVAALVVAFVVRSNQAPLVTPEQVTAIGGVPVEIDLLDWVEDEGGGLTVTVANESEHSGVVADLGDGLVSYTGPSRYSGPDSFDFTVRDEQGAESPATADILVTLGPIGGDFNIAVAEFTSNGQSASSLGTALHGQIEEALAGETDVDVEVAGPAEVRSLPGDTPEERAEAAADLADRTAADVVVYGTLDTEDGPPVLTTEFFISDRGLTGAKELAGAYAMDTQTLPSSDPSTLSIAAQRLEPKITALTDLAIGLSFLQLGDFDRAEERFVQASVDWPGSRVDSNGKEVVFNLLGFVSGLQEDLDDAEGYYQRALELDPDYARAHFGIAEILFQRSKGVDCSGGDVAGLQAALAEFDEVAGLDAPDFSFLSERSQIEMARIHLCLNNHGAGGLEEARSLLDATIPVVESEPRLLDVAADAHATLGSVRLLEGNAQGAATELETAAEMAPDSASKGEYYKALAFVYECELGLSDQAEAYLEEATALLGAPAEPIPCPNA